jgi:hypothetical protein
MPRRLSALMGGHPARAAGGLSLGRSSEFARAVLDWFSGRRSQNCSLRSFYLRRLFVQNSIQQ